MADTLPNGRTPAPTNADGSIALDQDWAPPPNFPATVISIQAISPEGFPVTLTLNDPAQGAMTKWIGLLEKQGFTPPTGNPTGQAPTVSGDAVPNCPNKNCSRYGKPMEPSNHGAGFFCKGKDETTGNAKNYCKATVR